MDRDAPTLQLGHASGATDIYVGGGAFAAARKTLARWLEGRRAFVVSSSPIIDRHGAVFEDIDTMAADAVRLPVPDGEAAKTLRCAEALWSAMLEAEGARGSRVVAVGGGSVTDVAGFVAATFMRGIELALIPTTLLAQVDAAIGGKTAIDLARAKNAVGGFWHPRLVIADTSFLASLDAAEARSGLVEVVKIAAAEDAVLFELLERHLNDSGQAHRADGRLLDDAVLEAIVERAIAAKVKVVESDPREADRRRVLNLGHTLGHAIESALDYRGLRHGEAVAYGLLFALRLAIRRGGDAAFALRVSELLRRLAPPPLPPLATADLLSAMRRDKKARRAGVVWVLPIELGRVEICPPLEGSTLEDELDRFLRDPWQLDSE